ncbi:MAG: late competence development ComFB family protein [Oscillatoriales cyanobacterium SM2_1_8]|nr:late competence development ComFB family protein [Oscillatoriales cyanobacterium SM2_1_8]
METNGSGIGFVEKKSTIASIVEQAFADGYLTPAMEAEVGRVCDSALDLSPEDYMALDRLMGGLLSGEVVAVPRKQFINVMEELVLNEAVARVAEIESSSERMLDLGDIAAYALNRLPPLYATSEEGAAYQRERALADLQYLIAQQVKEAIERNLAQPKFMDDRLGVEGHPTSPSPKDNLTTQLSSLLQAYASTVELAD